jgi:uncharacterized protein with FMN-binding domain
MRRVIATVVGTVISLVLLLSFKTHSLTSTSNAAIPPAVTTPSSAPPSDSSGVTAPSTPPSATPSASGSTADSTAPTPAPTTSKKATSTASRTVQGDAVDTRYGPVQVAVVLAGTKITAINILQVPDQERRDIEINNFAVPVLNQEALAAQSTKIDMVSGATYTSQGYLQSLQSALDKAGA